MRCPYCRTDDTQVLDTRDAPEGDAIRRRRRCNKCGQRFITYERVQPTSLLIVKKTGEREEYDRHKIEAGVRLACTKRPISAEAIEDLINRIESDLFRQGSPEVPAHVVGELVLSRLRDLDQVAYIRFASVYLNFADLAEMGQAIEALLQRSAAADRPV